MNLSRIVVLCGLALAALPAFAGYSLSPYQYYFIGSWADSIAVGDINGDGRDDVALATAYYFDADNDYKVFVFFQRSDGTLAAPRKYSYGASGTSRTGMALADLNHDGRMDIVVGQSGGITIMRWSVSTNAMAVRTWFQTDYKPADDVVVIDVDRDGNLDVVGQSWADGATVYFGNGLGGISRQVPIATPVQGYNDLESGDFNGDGHGDFAVLSGQGLTHAWVYYNDGSDDLRPPLEVNPDPGVTIGALGSGDFNDDGRTDLVVTRDGSSLSLFRQSWNGGLQAPVALPSGAYPNALVGHDLDRDGKDDLVVQHGSGPLGYFLRGWNSLDPEIILEGPYGTWFNTQGVAAGDINGDHCTDVVNANYNYGLVIYLGSGCATDLAVNLGATPFVVAVRLDNFGDVPAPAPRASTLLSVTSGTLSLGALPTDCSAESQTTNSVRVICTGSTLETGTSRTLLIPIRIAGGKPDNVLQVTATASSTSKDPYPANNQARKKILATPTVKPSGVPPVTRLRSGWATPPSKPQMH